MPGAFLLLRRRPLGAGGEIGYHSVGMLAFAMRRVALSLLVLWTLSLVSFCALASQDVTLNARPLLPAYWVWLKGVFTGRSLSLLTMPTFSRLNPTAGTTTAAAIAHTAVLLVAALVLVLLFAVGLALIAAIRRGSIVDVVLRGLTYFAWAVPAFLLALLVQKLIHTFGGDLGWGPFPLAGWPGSCPPALGLDAGTLAGCPAAGSGISYVANVLRYITLPALTLAAGFIGLHGRYLRAALLETLEAPFVVTAHAKGLTERRVVIRHALRASLPTFLSAVLSDFGMIFGAALAVDWVFALNGLGTVLISAFPGPMDQAAFSNTYSVQVVVVIAGGIVLAASFLSELVVAWLDPRTRSAA
jgi:ABC-type dipeptide/oligopeptide/nickel transport system permease component